MLSTGGSTHLMTKVLICNRHGGFGLSDKAVSRLRELGAEIKNCYDHNIKRDDPLLLQTFDEMGQEAAGGYCRLKVVEIPDDVEWTIEEYDGLEWVAEKHREWR